MNLTDEQKAEVRDWAEHGESLGGIQKRIEESFGLQLTYMETRMLVADLDISLRDKDRAPVKQASAAGVAEIEGEAGGKGKKPASGLSVTLDTIAQANAMVSGTVQFSDGEQGYWAIGGMGRLSLETETPGYRPSEQDVMAFQTELRQAMRRAGY